MGDTDYLAFFNLTEDPFRLTPDPYFFYPSKEHSDVLSSVDYAVEQKEGFALITGAPGTGKTTILRIFMEKWKERAEIALIMTPRLSPEDFLQALLEDLGVSIEAKNKNEMIKAFRDILIDHSASDKRVIIIVDEAQDLPVETLEELRLLSNLETDKEKLLQIVLVGQPELGRKLSSEDLTQLNQRIALRASLRPLNAEETGDYIGFRLAKSGKGMAAFTDGAKKEIHRLSKGIPRLINLFASRSLMAAYVEGKGSATKTHVGYARRHLSDTGARVGVNRRLVVLCVLGVTLLVCLALAGVRFSRPTVRSDTGSTSVGSSVPDAGPASNIKAESPPVDQVKGSGERERLVEVLMDAHVRSGPSVDKEVVSWVPKGTTLTLTGLPKDSNGRKWHKVKLSNVKDGWISEKVLRADAPDETRK